MRSFDAGARNGGCADRGDHEKVPISWSGTGAMEYGVQSSVPSGACKCREGKRMEQYLAELELLVEMNY